MGDLARSSGELTKFASDKDRQTARKQAAEELDLVNKTAAKADMADQLAGEKTS